MITCYFGVPGCGKTTLLVKIAQQEIRRIKRGRSKYKYVFTNFDCVGCYKISFQQLENYLIEDSLILLDELMLDADNRGYKSFPLGIRDFLTLHRHCGTDIIYVTQAYDKVDVKIRALTQDLWYMSKSVIPFCSQFTSARRIYRKIHISEEKAELTLGYRFCNFLELLFVSNFKSVFRPFYYKYFDSYDLGSLGSRDWIPLEKWDFEINRFNLFTYIKYKVSNLFRIFRKKEE